MCYLIAKKFNEHGCLALKTKHNKELKYLNLYLTNKTLNKGLQILILNSPEAYPEYKPYNIIDDEKEFIYKVLKIAEEN